MSKEKDFYEVFDISQYSTELYESLGTKSKFWYEDENGKSYLFKSIKTFDSNKEVVYRFGEDWAEKIACEIAELLDMPHAHYELASYKGLNGVITEKFTRDGDNLSSGNELLEDILQSPRGQKIPSLATQRINRVWIIMEKIIVCPPLNAKTSKDIQTASDFFVGYLMLDTLISNQDRHNENWGMIETLDQRNYLTPTYDHGSSLGRNESDETRYWRLNTKDIGAKVDKYVEKAKSWFYATNGTSSRLKVLAAFELYGKSNPKAAIAWLNRLKEVDDDKFQSIVNRIPKERMSDVAKQFSLEMIRCNKRNLLSLLPIFESM